MVSIDDQLVYMAKGEDLCEVANFDLRKEMQDFSFLKLCRHPYTDTETQGAVVITGKQVIASFTKDNGRGPHSGLYARIAKELKGGGIIADKYEVHRLTTDLRKFIYARINYEVQTNEFGRPTYKWGYIKFIDTEVPQCPAVVENFEEFCLTYGEELMRCSEEFNLAIKYSYIDENGKTISKNARNLMEVLDYVKSRMNPYLPNPSDDDEVVIESSLNNANEPKM